MKNPERTAAAILYAELRNFTRLSEVLDPERWPALPIYGILLETRLDFT